MSPLTQSAGCRPCGLSGSGECRALSSHRLGEVGRLLRQTVVVLGALMSVAFSGFVIGALARLALPGPDPMPLGVTILLGVAGSLIGGGDDLSPDPARVRSRHAVSGSNGCVPG